MTTLEENEDPREANPMPLDDTLPPFEALRAFVAIARFGGVRKAAESLSRNHGVISRHLRTVEDWTGTRLIERTASGAVLTTAGARYHKQIASAINAISAATAELMEHNDDHRLCIRCMPGLALHWLSARLADFERAFPRIEIEVRPTDTTWNFHADHGDVHLRMFATYDPPSPIPSDYRSIEVARVPIVAVASDEYLARSPAINKPRDLLVHQLLHEEDFSGWNSWLACFGVQCDTKLKGLKLWQGHLTLDAARHGRGIALTNPLTAGDEFAAKRVLEIGKGVVAFTPQAMGVWCLIARADRWDAPPVSHFRSWLIAFIRREHPELQQVAAG